MTSLLIDVFNDRPAGECLQAIKLAICTHLHTVAFQLAYEGFALLCDSIKLCAVIYGRQWAAVDRRAY